ncbi:MAG: cell division protein ZapD [Gammaproteobacteria bacterium]
MTEPGQTVVYEQPLNERVRTFLRLEFLFAQHHHHRADRTHWGVRATLRALLDIFSIVSRSDVKTEILKELSEQHAALSRLQQRPGVDTSRLQSVLAELNEGVNAMQVLTTHTLGTVLRDNEFLISLLHRSTIPGGVGAFDLPTFHHWLAQPGEHIRRDLDAWFADLVPFDKAINLYLRLLRQSTQPVDAVAKAGIHVYTPPAEYELVRVLVAASTGVYPEISAGRHRFTVRFMNQRDVNTRPTQTSADVPFQLQCCAL